MVLIFDPSRETVKKSSKLIEIKKKHQRLNVMCDDIFIGLICCVNLSHILDLAFIVFLLFSESTVFITDNIF